MAHEDAVAVEQPAGKGGEPLVGPKEQRSQGDRSPVDAHRPQWGVIDRVLSRLSRVSTSGLFIPEIDGLRFFAISAVIAFHVSMRMPHSYAVGWAAGLSRSFSSIVSYAADVGFFGVELFFVISGFILSLPFAAHYLTGARRPSLRNYYVRRVTRLEPPYIISLIVSVPLLMFTRHPGLDYLLKHLGISLVYCEYFVYATASPLNWVLWSLECEIQFYILAPLFATVFRIRNTLLRRATIILLPATIYGVAAALQTALGAIGATGLQRLIGNTIILRFIAYFFAGFLLCDLFLTRWQTNPSRKWLWDWPAVPALVTIVMVLQADLKGTPLALSRLFLLPFLILLFYVAAFRGRIWNGIVRNRWLATAGGMCYTTYLYHDFIIRPALHRTASLWNSIPIQIAFYCVLCTVLCALPFALCEKPFMYKDWPSRVKGRLQKLW